MKKEVIISTKTKEKLLSDFRSKGVRSWGKRTVLSDRFLFQINKKDNWSRTTLDCIIRGELHPCEGGTQVSFRILPGPSSLLSFSIFQLALVISAIRVLILKNYVVEFYAYVFLGIVSVTNVLMLLFYKSKEKETRDFFSKLL